MSRLSIEIDPVQHRQIKTLATYAGLSIKDYILLKTLKPVVQDTDLADSKKNQRLREAIETPHSEHVVFESLEDLKHALGI